MADCSTPVERRQGKPGRRVWIDERAGRREPSWPTSGCDDGRRRRPLDRCGMPSARYAGAVPFKQQYVRTQKPEAYPLFNSQPVEVVEERRDVFRAPRREQKYVF